MKLKKYLVIVCVSSFLLLGGISGTYAQCAMCKAVAKSNMDSKQNQVGKGVNKGILYLLSVPYVLAGVGGLIWFRHRNKQTA